MSTIEQQLELERLMIDRGAAHYIKAQRAAEEKGRGADLDYAQKLISQFILPLVDKLKETIDPKGPGRFGRAKALLRRVDPNKAMFLALKGLFNSFSHDEPVVSTAGKIGKYIEDEIRFNRFQEMHGDYYDKIVQDFKRKGTKDYRYMQRVLTHSANTQNDQWNSWSTQERVDVGMRLLDIILLNTDLIEKRQTWVKKRPHVSLVPTDAAKAWIDEHEAMRQFMYPDRSPCLIPPDPWSSLEQGGYYSPLLRQYTPMVKVSGRKQRNRLLKADLTDFKDALNKIQNTAWEVNARILEVVREVWARNLQVGMPASNKLVPPPCPVDGIPRDEMTEHQLMRFTEWKREASEMYTREKDRVSKSFQVTRIIRMAADYAQHQKFWYVWYADFRGRLYSATAGFSPQGPDLAKGLLRFNEAKALGPRGLAWLKIHVANRYGFDKGGYAGRVKWVNERVEEFRAAAVDPISHRSVWANADKPWQFLAAIIELNEALSYDEIGIGSANYKSRLPIGLDGSCNGLQNFSAMLRDPIGGAATNLVPTAKPNDIYAQVAEVTTGKLRRMVGSPMATAWLRYVDTKCKGVIPRSLTKRPVMTQPYGSTRQTCRDHIFQYLVESDRDAMAEFSYPMKDKTITGNFAASAYLTPIVWDSIGEVVVAARLAMDWLQTLGSAVSKTGNPVVWTTYDGFPVVQDSRVIETVQVDTQLGGRFQVRIGGHSNKIDSAKQRSGISPNFVHSQDATHCRLTVRKAWENGARCFSVIHDDFGTHAADTDTLHKELRKAFVELYENHDPIAEIYKGALELGAAVKPPPEKGTLDIREVLKSPYFFG